MSIKLSPEDIRQKYNEISPQYDRLETVPEILGMRRLRQRIFSKATGKVLDVAAGTGKNLPHYPEECQITAIDLSEGMLDQARKRAMKLGRDVKFLQMDAEKLEFPDDHFDTVASSLSSCTFPNPVAALREMRRVCRPDGRILLLEHGRSRWGLIGRIQDWGEEGQVKRMGCHWNREPHQLVEEAGITIVNHRRYLTGAIHLIEGRP